MLVHFSTRIEGVHPSATLQTAAKAKKLATAGVDIIDLSIGQPDFLTPDSVNEAAITGIQNGSVDGYTPAAGQADLKLAIAQRIKAEYGVTVTPDMIAVTSGAKMALYSLCQILLDPGDQVLLPVPYWVSYEEQVRLAGGTVIPVQPSQGFKVTVEGLQAAVTDKTRVLILNSPQNPTGTVYSRSELTAIGQWAVAHGLLVIADDIYRRLVYNDLEATSLMQLNKSIVNQTIMVSGVSKTYAMTGWRIGYVVAQPAVIERLTKLLSHATGNPAAVSQVAAKAALAGEQQAADQMRLTLEKRLNRFYELVIGLPGFVLNEKPGGAFYLFPDVSAVLQSRGMTVDQLATDLLQQAHVAVVPGTAFGMPTHLRMSYAVSLNRLEEAVERIHHYLSN